MRILTKTAKSVKFSSNQNFLLKEQTLNFFSLMWNFWAQLTSRNLSHGRNTLQDIFSPASNIINHF